MPPSLAYYATLLRKDFSDYCNRRLSEIGLTQGMLFFILYVGRHPDCSPKALAQALHMDAGHTARSISKLEQGGFLLQEADPRDRRAHVLRLTWAGEEAFRMSHELFTQWDDEALRPLSGGEREQLMALLKKLIHMEEGMPCVREHSQPG